MFPLGMLAGEQDMAFNPINIRLSVAKSEVLQTGFITHLIEEPK